MVVILDEAFAGLATAAANAEKNLKNARELFDSYLDSVFKMRKGWDEAARRASLAFWTVRANTKIRLKVFALRPRDVR